MSGQKGTSSGAAETGAATSLSFVPALLANAFFGTGIGLSEGGFQTTGVGDFTDLFGNIGGLNLDLTDPFSQATSLVDPAGLGGDPFTNITGGATGGGLVGNAGSGLANAFGGGAGGNQGALGGILNPFDLVSNLTDLINPNINPGVSGGLAGIESGALGQLAGNNLLFGQGGVGDTFQEGLQTGFKPDLQPIIDEASRAFFGEIVPQLGQSNVALQEGVGPFSTDLQSNLLNAGGTLASQLGALEVQNQNLAGDRRGELLGLSPLVTNTLFNAGTDAGRNTLDLGEQLALQGTTGGRQATLLQALAGLSPTGAIQSSSSQNQSKTSGGGVF